MKKLIVLIVIAVALLFSGCNPVAPDYPECPDCICAECPDCVCPGGGSCGSCNCPSCPDLDCPDIPVEGVPEITFSADLYTLECEECCGTDQKSWWECDSSCYNKSTLSWEVIGADVVSIAPDIGYVGVVGSKKVYCYQLDTGDNIYVLTATNWAGSATADVTITRTTTP